MSTTKPSERFREWLSEFVDTALPGERLPFDKELASHWGVSLNTIRREMKEYRDSGRLMRIAGKGTFAPNPQDGPVCPERPNSVVDDLVSQLKGMISRGEAAVGKALPAIKTVSLQYNLSPVTVGSAYRQLCKQGFACKIGKRFWIGPFSPYQGARAGKQVIYYYDPAHHLAHYYSGCGKAHAVVKMERELIKHGYILQYRLVDNFASDADIWMRSGDFPFGAVFFFCEKSIKGNIAEKIEQTYRLGGNRMARICISNDLVPRIPGLHRMLIKQHSFTMVCRRLAEFVREKRYRRIVVYYGTPFREGRSLGGFMKIRNEVRHIDPEVSLHYIVAKPETKTPEQFLREQKVLSANGDPRNVFSKYGKITTSQIMDELEFCSDLQRVFSRHTDNDLWVFSRDNDASAALEWCNQNKIAVPNQVSIISIENNPSFYHLGISTCTEDWETIGYLAAHTIIKDIPVAKTNKGYIRTDALMLERQTTR